MGEIDFFFLLLLNVRSVKTSVFCHIHRASVMSGYHAEVHVLLRKYMPKGIFIHCSVHRLNLVVNDTCKVVCYIWDYFSIVSNIHSFFTESSVVNTFFKQAQQQLGLGNYPAHILSNYDLFWL